MLHSIIGIIVVIFLIWIAIKITMKVIKVAIIIVAILFLIGTAKTFIGNINHNQQNSSNRIVSTMVNNN